MTDILDLDGWAVLNRHQEDGVDVLEAEYAPEPTACLKCGTIGHLYRHGTKETTYLDTPFRGSPARLRAKVRRYKCRSCGETFLQPLGGVLTDRRMTERCSTYIQANCLRDTFVRIAQDVGCDDKTVRNLAGEYIASLEANHRPAMPDWLGIDETQIDGRMRCVITDVGERRLIDMLPDRDKVTVAGWLHRFKDRELVQGVAMDMWRPYRDLAKQMFPGRPVVVDKFHVVRTASYCMERVRIRLQKKRKAGERRHAASTSKGACSTELGRPNKPLVGIRVDDVNHPVRAQRPARLHQHAADHGVGCAEVLHRISRDDGDDSGMARLIRDFHRVSASAEDGGVGHSRRRRAQQSCDQVSLEHGLSPVSGGRISPRTGRR